MQGFRFTAWGWKGSQASTCTAPEKVDYDNRDYLDYDDDDDVDDDD